MSTDQKTKQLTLTAVLTAVALVLSYIERLIPLQLLIPLPGVKLGLANIVSLLALYFLPPGYAVLITILRCLLSGIFGGTVTSFLMSLSGGLLSVLVMMAARKSGRFSIYGVSILGAAAHNTGQVCMAALLLGTRNIFIYLSFLLLIAIVSGTCTGLAAAQTLKALHAVFNAKSSRIF